MRLTFDTHGNARQKDVARLWSDPTTTDILYGGSKGSGKSFLGCSLILGDALTWPGTFYFIARKTAADLVRYTVPSVHEVLQLWGVGQEYWRFNGQYNFFELHNGSRVYLIDAKYLPSDPMYERFGSMQMTRGWIEEAGEFTREAKANLQASVGRWKNKDYSLPPKLLVTCNPSTNFLFTEYYKPWRDGSLPPWRRFVQALPTDNKMLPEGYVENLMRTLSPSQVERLVFGNWEYEDDPNWLVDYDAVCDMFTNDFVPEEGEPFISTDLAGKGRDTWVVGSWKGMVCRIPVARTFSEGKAMEETLRRLSVGLKVPRSSIVTDADGLGFYLESYLKGIREFHGNARACDPEKFANIKTECAYKLAELINKRRIHVICTDAMADRIKQEMAVLKSEDTDAAESKRRLISKERMKNVLGHSPDFLDMLIMRMIFEVKPKAQGLAMADVDWKGQKR